MADDEPDDDDFDLEAARKAADAPKKKKNEKKPKGHGFAPGPWKSGDITMKKEESLYIMNKHEYHLKTAPFDARFPNQNQTRNCWQNYVDFNRCIKLKGEDYDPCEYFKRIYRSLCPNAWVEKWDEQVENGTFPGKI